MAITTYQEAPARGHNAPPADVDVLVLRLEEQHEAIFRRKDELIEAGDRVPATLDDDDTAKRAQDFVKQIAAAIKVANAAHDSEKEPFLASGRTVDTLFFGRIRDPLTELKKRIEARLTDYLRRKEEAERRRRQEEERRAREAAEAARRAAEEEAAAARRAQQEAERAAAEERRRADEAEAARRREEEARIASERDLQAAVRRQEEEAQRREAEEARRAREDQERQERARAEQEAADRRAELAEADAERAAKAAEAKAAELSWTRGEHGSVGSLKTFWDFRDLDRDEINLEALRQHIAEEALQKAVRSWVKANADGNRDLGANPPVQPIRGVIIFRNTQAQVR